MTTVEEAPGTTTPVSIEPGGRRGGPDVVTLRRDNWRVQWYVTMIVLMSFVGYASFRAFQNKNYYLGAASHRDLISPFYSPCLATSCPTETHSSLALSVGSISPALLILIFPLGFRLTCYYYRRSYYRSIWQSPPSCAVADAHGSYSGETRFPLILQNAHRWFFYAGLVFNVILSIDAVVAFRQPYPGGSHIGVSLGTLVLLANAALLWLYSLSCHSCRHLCGGQVRSFSKHPIRYKLWKLVTPLNARHMKFAWASLVFVALADLYVACVSSGVFNDPGLFRL